MCIMFSCRFAVQYVDSVCVCVQEAPHKPSGINTPDLAACQRPDLGPSAPTSRAASPAPSLPPLPEVRDLSFILVQ